jgi:hypothetical protein
MFLPIIVQCMVVTGGTFKQWDRAESLRECCVMFI